MRDFRDRCRRQHDQPHLFQQSGLGEAHAADGRDADRLGQARAYGDEWQIIHPEVARAGQGAAARDPRAGLSADRGADQPPPGRACRAKRSSARRNFPNGSSRACWRAKRGALGAHRSPMRTASRVQRSPRRRLAYDEIFANQLALLLLRQSQRRHRTIAASGHRRADRASSSCPTQLTDAQRRVIREIRGDMAQIGADAAAASGRCRLGKDAGCARCDADRGRKRRAGGAARADRNPRAPASCDACSASSTASACGSRS